MNYELAKELKDAGFPQKTGYYLPESGNPYDGLKTDWAYSPTLSELIEACDFEFKLEKLRDAPCEGEDVDTFTYEARNNTGVFYVSDTPEEALACLWLALNKKP